MANRTKVLETLRDYFQKKGRVLNAQEYSRETDTPVRLRQIINIYGGWKPMERLLMARDARTAPDAVTDIDKILKARNDAANAAAKEWKEASENQDEKAKREAKAQVVAEILTRNAATPEGANANKIAIGGKLPKEQQDYSAMGATVTTHPETLEQNAVDVKPEIATTANEDPRTPYELRDAAAAEGVAGGSSQVGTATAGGSTGEASVATVQALGADTVDADKINDKSKTNTTSTENTKVPADETKAAATKK